MLWLAAIDCIQFWWQKENLCIDPCSLLFCWTCLLHKEYESNHPMFSLGGIGGWVISLTCLVYTWHIKECISLQLRVFVLVSPFRKPTREHVCWGNYIAKNKVVVLTTEWLPKLWSAGGQWLWKVYFGSISYISHMARWLVYLDLRQWQIYM